MRILNPVLLTQKSTQTLSRPLLWCMMIVYSISGLINKDAWRADDAISFGMALSFSQTLGLESLQSVGNAHLAYYSPVWFAWLGVWIRLLFFIPASVAVIVPITLCIGGAVYAIRLSTYYMAKTPAAQPLDLALGGHPKPLMYANAVADGSILLLLAMLGIVLPLHEMTVWLAQFCILSMLLCGVSLVFEHPRRSRYLIHISMGLLGATLGLHSVVFALLWLSLLAYFPYKNNLLKHPWAVLRHHLPYNCLSGILGVLLPLIIALYLGQNDYASALWDFNVSQFSLISGTRLNWLISNVLFITWPTLPFSLLALWRWRHYWHCPHISLGATFMVVFLVKHMFQTQVNDGTLMAIVPGALVLSAFLLPALQRNIMNAIDWFGVMLLSCMGVLCWLVWCAMTLNVPSSLARNILRLAPEFDTSIRWWAVLIAVIMSIFWIGVVRWRVMSSKTVIWRAAVIWSAGSLMVWILMGTLFMPWFNHVKTYKTVARDLQNALSVSQTFNHCVTPMNISLPQRSALAYFGEIQFETEYLYHIESNTVSTCDWLLTYDLDKQLNKQGLMNTVNIDPLKWRLQFEGRRFIEKNERFKLYHKIQ